MAPTRFWPREPDKTGRQFTKEMKKIFAVLVFVFLMVLNTLGGEVVLSWDNNTNNPPGMVDHTAVYVSTNSFTLTNAVVNVPDPLNIVTQTVFYGPVYSFFVTAVATNSLESEVSNQIRYQRFLASIDQDNLLTLGGSTNWANAVITIGPSNGVLSGVLPNMTYRPTNYQNAIKDCFVVQIPETFGTKTNGTPENITNWYSVHFVYRNFPPLLSAEPDRIGP